MDDRKLVSFYARGGRAKKPKMMSAPAMPDMEMPAMKKGGKVKPKDKRPAEDLLKKGGRAKMAQGGNPMEGRYSTGIVVPKSRNASRSYPVAGALGRLK